MKVPLSWLKRYVPVSIPVDELARRLTMAGTEVGSVQHIGGDWDSDKILVGRVRAVDRHPNADRLTLPTVELGDGVTKTVVCGAPNVAAGQKIAFAHEGASLVSPRSGKVEVLKAATIRGVESAGMVCSELELGLGESHEGILVLDDDAPVGTPLVDYLGDAVLDLDVTPNRPDCLSILGVAHEVAALTGELVTEPEIAFAEEGPEIDGRVRIEIADPELCPRYTASLITGIQIGPSPRWMQEALTTAGQRPINNVVDITNYVMLEYGQPLHAFDFDTVKENKVIVRAARPGERLTTLDGEERTLNPPMLTIADASDAVGLAGVMGGVRSEMHGGTTSVLLESASFDPANTRRTSAALHLSTEASQRFERSIRAELAPRALRRATQLIVELAGGTAAKGTIDLYPGEQERPPVRISRRRLKQVLGVDLEMGEVERVLDSLGFEQAKEPAKELEGVIDLIEAVEAATAPERQTTLWMTVPYWRSDIEIEDDLVEEVARIIGYDAIPTTALSTSIPHHEPQPQRALKERLKDLLAASGMREIVSYSLTSIESLQRVNALGDGVGPLKIANPMSAEAAFLRTSLKGNLLEALASNHRVSQRGSIRLFEAGRVYLPREYESNGDLPHEKEMLVGVFSGPRFSTSWVAPEGDMGFYDAKGVLESVFQQLGAELTFGPSSDPILHPGRAAHVTCGDKAIGVVGEVHPSVLTGFDLGGVPVALFEIDLESVHEALSVSDRRYASTSRFPEALRDLALIVDADAPSATVQAIIHRHKLVARSAPFDVYSSEGVPAGKKSVAFSVVFQSASETLTTKQVNRAQEEILRQLKREVGAELRAYGGDCRGGSLPSAL